jgi:hypothetical protein
MSMIVIRCPHTGRDVSTGIEIDRTSFDLLPDILVRSNCPDCGMQHAWWKREAKLAGEDGKISEAEKLSEDGKISGEEAGVLVPR